MKTRIWRAPHYQWEPHWNILSEKFNFPYQSLRNLTSWSGLVLYNFDEFIAHVTPWHAWRNFHFITWLLRAWQGPDFVRCRTKAGYFSIVWLSLRWNIQRRHAAEAKFTRFRTQCPNLGQHCHHEVCHIFWPFVRTLHDTVTVLIFWHVKYPLWRVTDESIEIVQYK